MKLLKGQKVIVVLHGGGLESRETKAVLKVDKEGNVWLDNGDGNKPSGPYIEGKKEGVFGFWEEIILKGE